MIIREDKDREGFLDRMGGLPEICGLLGKDLGSGPLAVIR
jgi:hypothetical protein